jgi:hypothetical protein
MQPCWLSVGGQTHAGSALTVEALVSTGACISSATTVLSRAALVLHLVIYKWF